MPTIATPERLLVPLGPVQAEIGFEPVFAESLDYPNIPTLAKVAIFPPGDETPLSLIAITSELDHRDRLLEATTTYYGSPTQEQPGEITSRTSRDWTDRHSYVETTQDGGGILQLTRTVDRVDDELWAVAISTPARDGQEAENKRYEIEIYMDEDTGNTIYTAQGEDLRSVTVRDEEGKLIGEIKEGKDQGVISYMYAEDGTLQRIERGKEASKPAVVTTFEQLSPYRVKVITSTTQSGGEIAWQEERSYDAAGFLKRIARDRFIPINKQGRVISEFVY